jgi:catechol 2,3-dioxygenase-like lactoylglutathione lyase family enzyme
MDVVMGEATLTLVSLNSKNLERTNRFYSAFGANLRWDSLPSGTNRLLIEAGSTTLEFYPGDRYGKEPWVSLEFRVDSVYSCMVALGSEGFNPFGTSRYADDSGYDSMMYTDPDGHIVRLVAIKKETSQTTTLSKPT